MPSYLSTKGAVVAGIFSICLHSSFRFSKFASPSGTIYHGVPLGDWLAEQFELVRGNVLEPSKVRKLEDVGFSQKIQSIQFKMLLARNEERKRQEQEGIEAQMLAKRKKEQKLLERHARRQGLHEEASRAEWLKYYRLLQAFQSESGLG